MKDLEFAIVDIETTGSYAAAGGITEIAILISDGTSIIKEYQTLINPEQAIPYHIQALTGISDTMVENAPLFSDVAEEIYQLLEGRIFVAHNVHFDYSFVNSALKKAGYDWKAQRLCTVRLARRTYKNLASYSLGKLCQSLGIGIQDRHRANGDAQATAILFHRIFSTEQQEFILKATQVKAKEQRLPTHVPIEQFEKLPHRPGIYLFKNNLGKLVYVGKAVDIKKRVISHFTGNNEGSRRQQFINEIYSIEYQESGTELMAFLMECDLIKKHWPIYNRALKKYDPKYGLFCYEGQNGYLRLCIGQVRKHVTPIQYFNTVHESTQFLMQMIDSHGLDYRLCQFFNAGKDNQSVEEQINKVAYLPSEVYNGLVRQALDDAQNKKRSFVIVDRGRVEDEQSFIYVKENKLYAIGFLSTELAVRDIEEILLQEHKVLSNFYMNNLAEDYARKHPEQVHYLQGEILE